MTAFRYKFDTLINIAGAGADAWPIFFSRCHRFHVGRLSWALVVLTCETWQNVIRQCQNIELIDKEIMTAEYENRS